MPWQHENRCEAVCECNWLAYSLVQEDSACALTDDDVLVLQLEHAVCTHCYPYSYLSSGTLAEVHAHHIQSMLHILQAHAQVLTWGGAVTVQEPVITVMLLFGDGSILCMPLAAAVLLWLSP